MSCQKYQKDLSAFLDGELRGRDKERLEAHLKSCDAVRSDVATDEHRH